MRNPLILQDEVQRASTEEELDTTPITLLHCKADKKPLNMVRRLFRGRYSTFNEPATLLAKGNLIYGWDNEGVIESLYNKHGFQIAVKNASVYIVDDEHLFRRRFGIGDRMPTPLNGEPSRAEPNVSRRP